MIKNCWYITSSGGRARIRLISDIEGLTRQQQYEQEMDSNVEKWSIVKLT